MTSSWEHAHQVSSYNHSMLEHFLQKFLSDEAICSLGVSRSMTALYTLRYELEVKSKGDFRD